MGYLRAERARWAVALALFGLFMQVFIPLAQAITVADDDGVFPSRMVICTLYGAKIIDVVTGEEAPQGDDGQQTCPVCIAFSIGLTSLGGDVELPVLLPYGNFISDAVLSVAELSSQVDDSNYAARAPPLS